MLYINDGDAVFQSTLPMRGATTTRCSTTGIRIFQSTLPMRGATLLKEVGVNVADFNPRSPCGERPGRARMTADRRVISIHAPHAGSDQAETILVICLWISIHAPHAGSDTSSGQITWSGSAFQSTLPMRGATRKKKPATTETPISIHAPHAGSDRNNRHH